jgi:hypothetical protein
MITALVRVAFSLLASVASDSVAGESRFWTLSGVQFSDGAVANGYLAYDDSTHRITEWNIRVSSGESSWPVAAFTYARGNSRWVTFGDVFGFDTTFRSISDAEDVYRNLYMARFFELDGNTTVVPLRPGRGADTWVSGDDLKMGRSITGGSLVLATSAPELKEVDVDEFYNAQLDHYFITANAVEKQMLDDGVQPGWVRTGESFKAYAPDSRAVTPISPVCRYYGLPLAGLNSHFYSADADECVQVFWKYGQSVWLFETDNAFLVNLPDALTGSCPDGTLPVYRLLKPGADVNHRYLTRATVKEQLLAAGYAAEGYGPDGVAMCALR